MIDTAKKTFVIGLLVVLCFLNVVLMIKQFNLDEELANCRDKTKFLEDDVRELVRQSKGIYIPHEHEEIESD
jgi:hypothetical protein